MNIEILLGGMSGVDIMESFFKHWRGQRDVYGLGASLDGMAFVFTFRPKLYLFCTYIFIYSTASSAESQDIQYFIENVQL